MPPTPDIATIVQLDTRLKVIEARTEKIEQAVDALTALLNQAKGARWAILTVIGVTTALANAAVWAYGLLGRH